MLYSYGAQQWRAATWAKVLALWDASFHYDWVVWVDSDGVFPRAEWGLGYLLAAMDPQHHVLLYSDMPYNTLSPNTGIIVLRGGAPARRLLRHWWETTADLPLQRAHEQQHFAKLFAELIGADKVYTPWFNPELAAMVVQVELVQCANDFPRIAFPSGAVMEVSYFVQIISDFTGRRAAAIDRIVKRRRLSTHGPPGPASGSGNLQVAAPGLKTLRIPTTEGHDHGMRSSCTERHSDEQSLCACPSWVRHVNWDSIARAIHEGK